MEMIQDLGSLSARELKRYYEQIKNEIAREDMYQNAMKILINSLYGALGESSFRYYNPDMAEAITSTGQVMIKFIHNRLNEFLTKLLKDDKDYVGIVDTDSAYLIFEQFVDIISQKRPDLTSDELCSLLSKFCKEKVEPYIEDSYETISKYNNSRSNKMNMKREKIASSIVIRAKKNYAMDTLDNEGVRYAHPKLSVTGLESVRSTTPRVCRNALEDCYKILLREDNDINLKSYIKEFRERFFNEFSLEQIAGSTGIKGMEKYEQENFTWKSGTPFHVKAAITFNKALYINSLTHVKPISNFSKIKVVYLLDNNPFFNDAIAFEDYVPELEIEKFVDKQRMFEKYFLHPLESLTELLKWETEEKVNVNDFF